ncbi:peptidylprolyl isomerase [Ulvibacter litoralis]|uniref:Periplasmic chaperone PpiD n=1 Tax=Ulvibacter litoralis TaxID=227084 RepID=A0A1G7CF34_9FLAO|nr:peptidylprolyl isomerase [Ulvibacter litoralis]GHC47610.1 peptidylprolyl isomerase [Ulvibacter litoralis]SDE37889.1 peptidylprolyl isomerase/peptidyl-prolyl cis-trans isomerase D [Ulvibacter litoralis]
MAILNSIRKRGVFLIIIIALALFSFILADVIRNGGFSSEKSQTTVATVNGVDIEREGFMQQVENVQRTLGANGTTAQAVNRVWDNELRNILLEEQFEKLGLSAEKAQIADALRTNLSTNPTFLNDAGVFDEGKLQEYIASIKNSNPAAYQQWLDFEKSTAQSVLQNSYFNMIKGGLRSTSSEGEAEYRFENDKLNLEYVHIPFSKISDDDVPVSDAEIKAYVKEHASNFEVERKADIQYVSFSEAPSAEDVEDAKESVRALLSDRFEYNDTIPGFAKVEDYANFVNANSETEFVDRWFFKNELPGEVADSIFNTSVGGVYGPYKLGNTFNITRVVGAKQLPDSIQSKHILIRYEGSLRASSAIKRTKEAASKLADSLLSVVKRDKSKFESLAATFSDDASNKDKGGDLGYNPPGRMVPAFDDFTIGNKPGTIGVVETEFGFHIVGVEDHKNLQKAIKIATVTKEIEPSEKTLSDVFSSASKFEVASQKGDFAAIAKESSLEVKPVNKMGELDAVIPGVGNNRTIVNWAFDDDTSVGDVKRFTVPNGYVIAQLTRKSPKGLMSVAEASSTVTPILRNKKKAEKIRASITGTTLQEIASSQSVRVETATAVTMAVPTIPGAGSEPAVVGAAFGVKAGETTGLITGKTGVFKVRVLAVNKAPELESYATFANQLNAKVTPTVTTKVYNALKAAADIEDNRANFF